MTSEAGMKKTKKLPVGISDFKKIIEGNYLYVDKTLFIKDIIDKGDSIILIPRPRRFGKTLNLSMLQKVVLAIFSYYDFGNEPEKVYHALVAGLLTWISNSHEIKSNRESGYGRYDIMVIPKINKNQTGYVIEFKTADKEDGETVENAVEAALQQIEEKKYETELVERGIQNIKKLAVVFSGKYVHLKEAP